MMPCLSAMGVSFAPCSSSLVVLVRGFFAGVVLGGRTGDVARRLVDVIRGIVVVV